MATGEVVRQSHKCVVVVILFAIPEHALLAQRRGNDVQGNLSVFDVLESVSHVFTQMLKEPLIGVRSKPMCQSALALQRLKQIYLHLVAFTCLVKLPLIRIRTMHTRPQL